jgi:anaerobic selenocysteine-containing dehydrogenase
MFHSENRHWGMGTREQHPDPIMELHPDAAGPLGIAEGDWVCVETRRGVIRQRAHVTNEIHPRVINVQRHWWFPEQPAPEPSLHGLWQSNCNVLTMGDDPDTYDPTTELVKNDDEANRMLTRKYRAPFTVPDKV